MKSCKLVMFSLSMVLVQIITLIRPLPVALASRATFSSHLALPEENGNAPVRDIYGNELTVGGEYFIMSPTAGWGVEHIFNMQGHPLFKRFTSMSEPVVTKSQEIAEDICERWETSDHPVVHKIQDLNETVLGESTAATSFKEIRRRDPSFSLPEFVAEVQEVIWPVLEAFFKGDTVVLKKYCSKEIIERCKAERQVFDSQGMIFDNKILHISDVEVRGTKMMGDSPLVMLAFQTQQVHCIRDKLGSITEGGKDTIHTVYYDWAMQLVEAEELGEGAIYPIQQSGVSALI